MYDDGSYYRLGEAVRAEDYTTAAKLRDTVQGVYDDGSYYHLLR